MLNLNDDDLNDDDLFLIHIYRHTCKVQCIQLHIYRNIIVN